MPKVISVNEYHQFQSMFVLVVLELQPQLLICIYRYIIFFVLKKAWQCITNPNDTAKGNPHPHPQPSKGNSMFR